MAYKDNKVGPPSPRFPGRGPSSLRLPEIDPALRPPLYPGRDANVVGDCPPNLLPHVRGGPFDVVKPAAR